jgi:hypothetical protein
MERANEQQKPERDIETTVALHNLIAKVCDDLQIGENYLDLDLKTEFTHNKIFPDSNCKGDMSIIVIETLIGFMNLNCSEGCKDKLIAHTLHKPDEIFETELPFFTLTFEDIGYLSPEYSIDEKNRGYWLRPQIFRLK